VALWRVFVLFAIGLLLGGMLGCSQFNTKLTATDGYQEVTTPIGFGVLIRTDTWIGVTTGPDVGTAHERSNFEAAADRPADADKEPPTVLPPGE
jgi:hypothetical protein